MCGSLTVSCYSAIPLWNVSIKLPLLEREQEGMRRGGSCINLSLQFQAFLICYVNLSL